MTYDERKATLEKLGVAEADAKWMACVDYWVGLVRSGRLDAMRRQAESAAA